MSLVSGSSNTISSISSTSSVERPVSIPTTCSQTGPYLISKFSLVSCDMKMLEAGGFAQEVLHKGRPALGGEFVGRSIPLLADAYADRHGR